MRGYELSRTQINNIIDEWILNERNRKLLKRRFVDGICYEPLAEEFELSVRQVKSIVHNAEEIILRHLT